MASGLASASEPAAWASELAALASEPVALASGTRHQKADLPEACILLRKAAPIPGTAHKGSVDLAIGKTSIEP